MLLSASRVPPAARPDPIEAFTEAAVRKLLPLCGPVVVKRGLAAP